MAKTERPFRITRIILCRHDPFVSLQIVFLTTVVRVVRSVAFRSPPPDPSTAAARVTRDLTWRKSSSRHRPSTLYASYAVLEMFLKLLLFRIRSSSKNDVIDTEISGRPTIGATPREPLARHPRKSHPPERTLVVFAGNPLARPSSRVRCGVQCRTAEVTATPSCVIHFFRPYYCARF